MGDWRERTVGESYHGPSDEMMLFDITCFGKRSKCTYTELLKHHGTHNKGRLDEQLDRLVKEGKLVRLLDKDMYYCIAKS